MIHKYLLLGKLVSLSSLKVENPEERHSVVELRLPIEVFWRVSSELQKANLLLSQDAATIDIQSIYQKVYATVFPYTVNEAERALLRKRMVGGG